jgi:hypothetical protein
MSGDCSTTASGDQRLEYVSGRDEDSDPDIGQEIRNPDPSTAPVPENIPLMGLCTATTRSSVSSSEIIEAVVRVTGRDGL